MIWRLGRGLRRWAVWLRFCRPLPSRAGGTNLHRCYSPTPGVVYAIADWPIDHLLQFEIQARKQPQMDRMTAVSVDVSLGLFQSNRAKLRDEVFSELVS